MPQRLRVLLSAYACEPGKGSEPGTGWHLAMELSRHFDVTVLTRENNREVIEAALSNFTGAKPEFLYHDLSFTHRLLKRKGILPTQLYYALWQRDSRRMLASAVDLGGFDIFHHLTFNSFEISPGVPAGFSGALIRGPLGGGQTTPAALLASLGLLERFKERLRSLRVRWSARNVRLRRNLAACDLVLYANRETEALLECGPYEKNGLMIDVGVDPSRFIPANRPKEGIYILSASNFEPRKGIRLLLLAFQRAHRENPRLRLHLAGAGKLSAREKAWVDANGLAEAVRFPGRLDHARMAEELAAADMFVFPSLRDTSGAVVLEAMACGLPIICLDHQGAKLMVGDGCGIRIVPGTLESTINEIAGAIVKLGDHSELRESMGNKARERVLAEFSWERKASRLADEYRRLAGQ